MSLEEFLSGGNDDIDQLYRGLAEQMLLVDQYKDLQARFNMITEVINNRYPYGLPSQAGLNKFFHERNNVMTANDLDEKPELTEECEEFKRRASQVELYMFERDQWFSRLYEEYLFGLLRMDDLPFRRELWKHTQLMKYVDERWPPLTVMTGRREQVNIRVQGVLSSVGSLLHSGELGKRMQELTGRLGFSDLGS